MTEDRLTRIEQKLDGVATELVELRTTTADLAVGQGNLEHRFDTVSQTVELVGHRLSRTDRDWTRIEEGLRRVAHVSSIRDDVERGFAEVIDRIERRVKPLEDDSRQIKSRLDEHEERIARLETGRSEGREH